MQSSNDYNLLNALSVLIQGPPGTGKTSLALQFPDPYVADLDNNLSGVIRRLRVAGDKREFFYDTIDRMPDPKNEKIMIERPLKERYGHLGKCLSAAAVATKEDGSPKFRTLIVDGCSKLNAYIIAEIGRQNPNVGDRARKEGEMTLQDWGSHLYMWQNFVTRLQTTSQIIVFTAHEEASDRPDLQGMLISIQGKKAQAQLGGMFSDVWRTEIKDTLKSGGREYEWLVRTMGTSTLQLKNSLGLPDTFKMDWKTIQAKLNAV